MDSVNYVCVHIIKLSKNRLLEKHPKDDYQRELLELTVIVLGGKLSNDIKIPGDIHHARWMAKTI